MSAYASEIGFAHSAEIYREWEKKQCHMSMGNGQFWPTRWRDNKDKNNNDTKDQRGLVLDTRGRNTQIILKA